MTIVAAHVLSVSARLGLDCRYRRHRSFLVLGAAVNPYACMGWGWALMWIMGALTWVFTGSYAP